MSNLCVKELGNSIQQTSTHNLFSSKGANFKNFKTLKESAITKKLMTRINNMEVARQQLNDIIEYVFQTKNEYIFLESTDFDDDPGRRDTIKLDREDKDDEESKDLKRKTYYQLNISLDELLLAIATHVCSFLYHELTSISSDQPLKLLLKRYSKM